MSGTDWAILVAVIVLFVVSIVLAVAETAFTRMSRIRALSLEEEGKKGARRLAQMLEQPERTLNVVLLLVLVSQLTSAYAARRRCSSGRSAALGVVHRPRAPDRPVLRDRRGRAEDVRGPAHRPRRAARLRRSSGAVTNFPPLRLLSRGLIGLANVDAARARA